VPPRRAQVKEPHTQQACNWGEYRRRSGPINPIFNWR